MQFPAFPPPESAGHPQHPGALGRNRRRSPAAEAGFDGTLENTDEDVMM